MQLLKRRLQMQFGETKEVMKYETILTIKETEKATVVLAAVEGIEGPVIVKKLKGANADVYRLLCHAKKSCFPVIYAIEETESELLIAEEHIAGETLGEVFGKRTFTDQEKLELALKLCDAVEFLHHCEPPVIHRDIKPSNILVTKSGEVKLIDFDASRLYKEKRTESDTRLLGTAEYAPPEQFGYAQTDVRSDIYSLGVVLREFTFSGGKIGRKWEKIVQKCTNFAPEHRYQSVRQLRSELQRLLLFIKIPVSAICGWGVVVLLLAGIFCSWRMFGLHSRDENVGGGEIVTSEDMQGLSVTPAPTAVPVADDTPPPTSVPHETLSPTPIPRETLSPTPVPTSTPIPTNTPIPTEIPEEFLTPEQIAQYQEEIRAYLKENNKSVDYYRKGAGEFLIYSSLFENWELTEIEFVDFMTQETVVLKAGEFFYEDSIVRIPEEKMDSLEKRYYEMNLKGISEGKETELGAVCKVTTKEERPNKEWHVESTDLEYDAAKHDTLHVILYHGSERKITGLCFGRVVEIEPDLYRILYDGKAMELSKELLYQYSDRAEVDFYVVLGDGTKERVTVYYMKDE